MPSALRTGFVLIAGWVLAAGLSAPAGAAGLDIAAAEPDGSPLADTVVTLWPAEEGEASGRGRASDGEPVITQRDQRFVPHVRVVPAGTTVRFPNEDDIKHHVYSFSKAKQFQLRLYGGDEVKTVTFDRPGVVVLGCNIHDHMLAYVFVTQAPYFAKTDETGRARIDGIPEGRYRAETWHPRLEDGEDGEDRAITLTEAAEETMAVSLSVKPPRRRRTGDSGY